MALSINVLLVMVHLVDYDRHLLTWKCKQIPVHPFTQSSTIDSVGELKGIGSMHTNIPMHANITPDILNSEYADKIG